MGVWQLGTNKNYITMILINLIKPLKNRKSAEKFVSNEMPDMEFDQIDVYVKSVLAADSEVMLFDAETIPNQLVIETEGSRYINVFPLQMLQEMVEEYVKQQPGLKDEEILNNILKYREKDA